MLTDERFEDVKAARFLYTRREAHFSRSRHAIQVPTCSKQPASTDECHLHRILVSRGLHVLMTTLPYPFGRAWKDIASRLASVELYGHADGYLRYYYHYEDGMC